MSTHERFGPIKPGHQTDTIHVEHVGKQVSAESFAFVSRILHKQLPETPVVSRAIPYPAPRLLGKPSREWVFALDALASHFIWYKPDPKPTEVLSLIGYTVEEIEKFTQKNQDICIAILPHAIEKHLANWKAVVKLMEAPDLSMHADNVLSVLSTNTFESLLSGSDLPGKVSRAAIENFGCNPLFTGNGLIKPHHYVPLPHEVFIANQPSQSDNSIILRIT
jgi:hypothetical protein